jgi:hypothetical protein
MKMNNWHGYYKARHTEEGDYEIHSVLSTLGKHSVPGLSFPGRVLTSTTKKVDPSLPQATL